MAEQAVPGSTSGLRTFYRLLVAQVLSMITSAMTSFAVALWVTKQTGDATPLALTGFFGVLPALLLGNVAGYVVDRFDRRVVLAVADGGQAIGSLLLLLSFSSGNFQLWHLYAVAAINACFAVFQWPAAEATVTLLVPDERRNSANGLRQLTGPLAGIVAPALTGMLFGILNVPGIIMLDLLTFLIASGVTLTSYIPRPVREVQAAGEKENLWRAMTEGFRFVWKVKPLLALMLYVSAINFLFTAANVLLIPYALGRTGSEAMVGLISSVMGVGMLIGGILITVFKGKILRIPFSVGGIGLAVLMFGLHGMAQSVPLLLLTGFFFTFPLIPANALFSAVMQAKTPPALQGRVFALLGQLSMLMSPLGLLLIGPLADNVFKPLVTRPGWTQLAPLFGTDPGAGFGVLFVLVSVLGLIITAVVLLNPRIRNVEREWPDYEVEPADIAEEAILPATPVSA